MEGASDKEKKKSRELCSKAHIENLPARWLCDALEYYGLKKVEKLLTFIYDEDIDDLHSSNLGYKDGRPVIIDYAGYYE